MKNWNLARRDLLKHLGVGAACLPLLRATRSWGQPAARKHFICILQTEGYVQAQWRPDVGPLAGQKLLDIASPLEPHKDDVIFLPDMTNPFYTAGSNQG